MFVSEYQKAPVTKERWREGRQNDLENDSDSTNSSIGGLHQHVIRITAATWIDPDEISILKLGILATASYGNIRMLLCRR